MFEVPALNKNEKEKHSTKKWQRFPISLKTFELDDVSDLKIIEKLVLKLLDKYIIISFTLHIISFPFLVFLKN